MVDHLREERVRLAEQHQFLGQVLAVSPSGVVILDFDGAISSRQPGGGAPARASGGRRSIGRPLDDARLAARRRARPASARASAQVVGLERRARASSASTARSSIAASRAAFCLIEELTEELRQSERAAYEKLIRVMSHEVNNTVAVVELAAALVVSPTRASCTGDSRTDFETGDRHRDRSGPSS